MKFFYTTMLLICLFFGSTVIYSQETVSKWVVITSINYPTEAIQKLATLPDWHIVVVADKKTPKDWNYPGCHFLSIEKQQTLGYRITELLPWNHYSRKNIGYLYAIQHGANIIFDTDDDNIICKSAIDFLPTTASVNTIQTNKPIANVYAYFGQPNMWPRGYPLEEIVLHKLYKLIPTTSKPLIQQGLVNEDPDVDAIFRLTQGTQFNFNSHAPIGLPCKTMCPFNTQNTIFHQDAFWGLLIPITTTFRVCDIWRGYITQRLLWDIGGILCFMPAIVVQKRNEHNLINDFSQEIDLYIKSGSLVNFLIGWSSDLPTLEGRICALNQALIEKKFYLEKERELLHAWLQDLHAIGYTLPAIQ